MGKIIRFMLCAGLVMGLAIATVAYAQDTPEARAQKASEQWLALLDNGKFGESWDAASAGFKHKVSRDAWESQLTNRAALGKLISRKLMKAELLPDLPDIPPGQYVRVLYHSSFENMKSAVELVIPILDNDGKWRVSNYLVRNDEQ
jgi:hypothetical protein